MATYDSNYYKTKIQEMEDKIAEYAHLIPSTQIRNGNDSITVGDAINHYKSLIGWYKKLMNEALVAEGRKSSGVRNIRYDLGE